MNIKGTDSVSAEQILFFWLTPILLSLLLLPAYGTGDMFAWSLWSLNIQDLGLAAGYARNTTEHPPGMSLLFYACLQLEALAGIASHYGYLIWKAAFLLASWLSAWLIWYWSRNHALALLGGGLCCYFGVGLSYLDGLLFPPLLLACYLLATQRVFGGLLCYACACYIKFPPLIFGPFIFIYLVRTYSLTRTIKVGLAVLGIYVLACLPFGSSVFDSFVRAFQHSTLSAQALNFNWLLTRYAYTTNVAWAADTSSLSTLYAAHYPQSYVWLSRLAFFSGIGAALWLAFKRHLSLENTLACAFIGHFSYYMFAIGVHENHFFYSAVVVIALCCINPTAWFGTATLVCGINAINVLLFYGLSGSPIDPFLGDGQAIPAPVDLHLLVAAFNFAVYGGCWIALLRRFDQPAAPPSLSVKRWAGSVKPS